jgi:hypothetical protein
MDQFNCVQYLRGGFFIDVIHSAALWSWGRLNLEQKWVPGILPGGYRRPVRSADKLTTFMCRLSVNSGTIILLETSGPLQIFTNMAVVCVLGEGVIDP